MAKMVMGAFRDKASANDAILELEDMGVESDDFSLFMMEDSIYADEEVADIKSSKAEAGAEDGATVGGSVGGLAGLVFGAITTAGMYVAGPALLLAGLGWTALTTIAGGAAGAVTGGFVGALVGMGVPEDTAEEQTTILDKGGILIAAENSNVSESRIRDVLEKNGAEELVSIEHGAIPAHIHSSPA